jgi:hypothetical protein
MFRRATAALLIAIGATGCTAPSAPSYFTADFILIDVDGLGLPVTGPDVHGMPGSRLIAGSMSLDEAGTGYIFEERVDAQNNHFSVATPYLYGVSGPNIKFDYAIPCPYGVVCPEPPSGEIINEGLQVRVTFPPTSNFKVYTFRTVPRTL